MSGFTFGAPRRERSHLSSNKKANGSQLKHNGSELNSVIMAMKWRALTGIGSGILALSACGNADDSGGASPAYARLLRTMYRNTVPTVTATRLVQQLQLPTAPLLLDIRTDRKSVV